MNGVKKHENQRREKTNQTKDQHYQKRKSQMTVNPKGKPALEIYRPPTLRSSILMEENDDSLYFCKGMNGAFNGHENLLSKCSHNNNNNNFGGISLDHSCNRNRRQFDMPRKSGLNIHAKEFVSFHHHHHHQTGQPSLYHSSSSSSLYMIKQQPRTPGLHHSKSGHNLLWETKQEGPNNTFSKMQFTENKENDPESKLGMTRRVPQIHSSTSSAGAVISPIKRSKSLGSMDVRQARNESDDFILKIGPFSPERNKVIAEAIRDPTKLNARQLMDLSRHIFLCGIESSRNAEPTVQICMKIIEKENGETFLETLLNTCQKFYHERDNLQNAKTSGTQQQWIGYMSFLREMYTQLKRRNNEVTKKTIHKDETPPGTFLLWLLAQCCFVCLEDPNVNSLPEAECLFFALTAVGKDIEEIFPQFMVRIMSAARDAFLVTTQVPNVRKTLLQLIEMHAAKWNLSAPAVLYYYPDCNYKLSDTSL